MPFSSTSSASSIRLAMWSGPRNISTALMRSWENRNDSMVCDEPLYAHYLHHTQLSHPGAETIIQNCETDWRKVVKMLTETPLPSFSDHSSCSSDFEPTLFYQKHMAHHLLPHIELDWIFSLTNCFLIRHPAEMLPSLIKVYPQADVSDTGFPQQVKLFRLIQEKTGKTPPVIDSRDVLQHPQSVLEQLCQQIGVPFQKSMLSWPAGKRKSDGIWAPHWYANVEKSTGFQPYSPKKETVPHSHQSALETCIPLYETLYSHRLIP